MTNFYKYDALKVVIMNFYAISKDGILRIVAHTSHQDVATRYAANMAWDACMVFFINIEMSGRAGAPKPPALASWCFRRSRRDRPAKRAL
jgi:hypothetical protein